MVLSSGEFVESRCSAKRLSEGAAPHEDHETASDVACSIDLSALSEFLLTNNSSSSRRSLVRAKFRRN